MEIILTLVLVAVLVIKFAIAVMAASLGGTIGTALWVPAIALKLFGILAISWLEAIFFPIYLAYTAFCWVF